MSGGIVYFVVALAAWPVFAFLLHRTQRPRAKWQQLAVAAGMALTWPLALSLAAFAGVAVARLIGASSKKADTAPGAGDAVSPSTINV